MSYFISVCSDPAAIRAQFTESAPWDGTITPRVVAPSGASVAMVWLTAEQITAAVAFSAVLSLYRSRAEAAAAHPALLNEIRAMSTISNSGMDVLPPEPSEEEPA